jgi:flagellin-like protein
MQHSSTGRKYLYCIATILTMSKILVQNGNKKMKKDNVVSPVIGSILLVAITVIIVAVAAAFVFGMVGDIQKGKIVAVTSQKINNGAGSVEIHLTNHGGNDASSLVSGDGAFIVTLDGISATVTGLTDEVGSVGIINTDGGAESGPQHIVVVGHFTDGTSKVVLDTTT